MITFKKAKLRKSHYQTNIDKHREAANNTEYHIKSKLYQISFKNLCKNVKNKHV